MYYYDYKESAIDKYKINMDKDTLLKIKREVIDKCSTKIKREYDTTCIPNEDGLTIRHLTYTRNGFMEYKDGPDEPLYRVSYLEYKFPKLVEYIDKILKEDVNIALGLYKGELKEVEETFDIKIEKLSKELDEIDNLDIKSKRKKLDELENVLKCAKLNQHKQSVLNYYDKVKNLIYFEKVDSITKEEVDKVDRFFERPKVKK